MPNQHRNNAAEWVMTIAIAPFAWLARRRKKAREARASKEPSGSAAGHPGRARDSKKPARSKVMIEGLPPRTMN